MLIIDRKKVRVLMAERDIPSLAALGALLDPPIHQNTLYGALAGDRGFVSDTADRIARALGVSALDILTEVEDEEPLKLAA